MKAKMNFSITVNIISLYIYKKVVYWAYLCLVPQVVHSTLQQIDRANFCLIRVLSLFYRLSLNFIAQVRSFSLLIGGLFT